MKPVISPKELALSIGVSESTVKRWVDDGTIVAERSSGGHRRITIDAALRFARETQTRIVRPDVLGLPAEAAIADLSPNDPATVEQLHAALAEGNATTARGLLFSMYLGGMNPAAICDGPIHNAMSRIGRLWQERNGDGVFIEHRASDICAQSLVRMRGMFTSASCGAIAVGGAAPGDYHVLPTLAASIVLESAGQNAVNLGPDTPFDSFLTAAITHQPAFVWISVSVVENARTLTTGIMGLASKLKDLGVRLAVGGYSVDQLRLPRESGIFQGRSLTELAAFAIGLAGVARDTA